MSCRSPSTVPMTTVPMPASSPGHVRTQEVEAGLHDPGAEQHLGDEALAFAHARADHVHAGQQRLVEDLPAEAPVASRAWSGRTTCPVAVDDGLLELVFHAAPAVRSLNFSTLLIGTSSTRAMLNFASIWLACHGWLIA